MDNINFIYNNKGNLIKYDELFSNKYFFKNEISSTVFDDFIVAKQKRYIINSSLINDRIFLSTLECEQTCDGFNLNCFDKNTLLIPVGENVYFLAFSNATKKELDSILYTFMENNNCVIDINKYLYMFKNNYITIDLYKKK